jgi:hypothetical protein
MFVNGSAEPITERMFPIEIEHIGKGWVRGVGKLVTKVGGRWAVPAAPQVEVSIYRWAVLLGRSRAHAAGGSVWLPELGEGEVAIVESLIDHKEQ